MASHFSATLVVFRKGTGNVSLRFLVKLWQSCSKLYFFDFVASTLGHFRYNSESNRAKENHNSYVKRFFTTRQLTALALSNGFFLNLYLLQLKFLLSHHCLIMTNKKVKRPEQIIIIINNDQRDRDIGK